MPAWYPGFCPRDVKANQSEEFLKKILWCPLLTYLQLGRLWHSSQKPLSHSSSEEQRTLFFFSLTALHLETCLFFFFYQNPLHMSFSFYSYLFSFQLFFPPSSLILLLGTPQQTASCIFFLPRNILLIHCPTLVLAAWHPSCFTFPALQSLACPSGKTQCLQ